MPSNHQIIIWFSTNHFIYRNMKRYIYCIHFHVFSDNYTIAKAVAPTWLKDSRLHTYRHGTFFSERVPFAFWCFRDSASVNVSLFIFCQEVKMKNKNFFMVSNQIFSYGLKPKAFIVYCCLLRYSDQKERHCFPSRGLISKECNMDKKTVDSAIKDLETIGLIKKISRYRENGSRTSNMYYIVSLLE